MSKVHITHGHISDFRVKLSSIKGDRTEQELKVCDLIDYLQTRNGCIMFGLKPTPRPTLHYSGGKLIPTDRSLLILIGETNETFPVIIKQNGSFGDVFWDLKYIWLPTVTGFFTTTLNEDVPVSNTFDVAQQPKEKRSTVTTKASTDSSSELTRKQK